MKQDINRLPLRLADYLSLLPFTEFGEHLFRKTIQPICSSLFCIDFAECKATHTLTHCSGVRVFVTKSFSLYTCRRQKPLYIYMYIYALCVLLAYGNK